MTGGQPMTRGQPRTGGPPWAGGIGDDTACVSAGSVVAPRRSDAAADRTSLSFTEVMRGYYTAGESRPRSGERAKDRKRFTFQLTITTDDVSRFLNDREHLARAEGWIDAAGHGGRRPVQRGWFNLFAPADAPDRKLMRYRLHFDDAEGQPRTLTGWKNIRHGPPTDIWPHTSTLYFRLLDGHVADGDDDRYGIIGAGVLRIQVHDFARQLTTFRTRGPDGLGSLFRFGGFFLGQLWQVYRPRRSRSQTGT